MNSYENQYCALNVLLNIMEKSGNLRKDLKKDIVDSVSTLRNIFANIMNSEEEHTRKIHQLEGELNKAKAEIRTRVINTPRGTHCHLGAGTGKLLFKTGITCCHLLEEQRSYIQKRSIQV